jgi:hypothetical protein
VMGTSRIAVNPIMEFEMSKARKQVDLLVELSDM